MWYRCTNQCRGSYVRELVILQAVETAIDYLADAINCEQVLAVMPDLRLQITQELERMEEELRRIADARKRLTTASVELQTIDDNEYKQRMDEYAQRAETINRQCDEARNRLHRSDDDAARRRRLDEVVREGMGILHGDMHEANAWIRRHFRI